MSNATRACNIQKDEHSIFTLGGRGWDWRLGTGVGNRLKQIGNRDREPKLETKTKTGVGDGNNDQRLGTWKLEKGWEQGLGTEVGNRGWQHI